MFVDVNSKHDLSLSSPPFFAPAPKRWSMTAPSFKVRAFLRPGHWVAIGGPLGGPFAMWETMAIADGKYIFYLMWFLLGCQSPKSLEEVGLFYWGNIFYVSVLKYHYEDL